MTDATEQDLPEARIIAVEHLDAHLHRAVIRCPYCGADHRHGIDPADADHGTRASHCHRGEYRLTGDHR